MRDAEWGLCKDCKWWQLSFHGRPQHRPELFGVNGFDEVSIEAGLF